MLTACDSKYNEQLNSCPQTVMCKDSDISGSDGWDFGTKFKKSNYDNSRISAHETRFSYLYSISLKRD